MTTEKSLSCSIRLCVHVKAQCEMFYNCLGACKVFLISRSAKSCCLFATRTTCTLKYAVILRVHPEQQRPCLDRQNVLFNAEPYVHSAFHCCSTVRVYITWLMSSSLLPGLTVHSSMRTADRKTNKQTDRQLKMWTKIIQSDHSLLGPIASYSLEREMSVAS